MVDITDTVTLENSIAFSPVATAWAIGKNLLDVSGNPPAIPETAADVTYNSETVQTALDKLNYVDPVISSLSISPNQIEQGVSTTATLTWTISGTITGQKAKNVNVPYTDRSKVYNSVSTSTTYDLVVEDTSAPGGTHTATRSVNLIVIPRRYWGISTLSALASADVVALSNSELSNARAKSVSIAAGVSPGNFVYYAYPASLGDPINYKLFGFEETPTKTTVTVTTAVGAVLDYTVLRSANALIGSVAMEII